MARGPLRMSDLGLAGCGNRSRFSIRAVRGRCPDHRAYVSAHAVLRVVAAISGSLFVLIQISATLWIGSFALFALWYGHVLLTPRVRICASSGAGLDSDEPISRAKFASLGIGVELIAR
jgi:hypothetical protein